MQINEKDYFIWHLSRNSFEQMTLANSISFYLVNWAGLIVLIWLVYRIRHTSDDTFLRRECVCVVGLWVLFSILQIATFVYNYIMSCQSLMHELTPE